MVLAADVQDSTPLSPAGLHWSADARPALHGQHYLSDLCRSLLQGFHQGLTGLGGVNMVAAVKAPLKRLVLKDKTLLSDESSYSSLSKL